MSKTLLRQWAILSLLPYRPKRIDARSLEEMLRERGFAAHRRTIQRDLVLLARILPIVADERNKPFGWRWADGAAPPLGHCRCAALAATPSRDTTSACGSTPSSPSP